MPYTYCVWFQLATFSSLTPSVSRYIYTEPVSFCLRHSTMNASTLTPEAWFTDLRKKLESELPFTPPKGGFRFQRMACDQVLILDTGAEDTLLSPSAWTVIDPGRPLGRSSIFGTPIEASARRCADLVNARSVLLAPTSRKPCALLVINCAYLLDSNDAESLLSDAHALLSGTIMVRDENLFGRFFLKNKHRNFNIPCFTDLKTHHVLTSHVDN